MGKGQEFERQICKKLSLWWTEGERDDIFWRSAGSGARATVRRKKDKDTANSAGDITFTDPIGAPFINVFNVELKKGYNTTTCLYDCVNPKKKSLLLQWLAKVKKEACQSRRKSYLLILKRDRKNTIIFVQWDFFIRQEKYSGIFQEDFFEFRNDNCSFVCCDFDHFLNWITPEDIRRIDEDSY